MAVSPRLIRRRIKSVTNTKKITKAMELVAASKMRRAIAGTIASRRYAGAGWEMITALAKKVDPSTHALLAERPTGRALVILLTSHRGLAGGFNANMIKKVMEFIRDPAHIPGASSETTLCFAAVGRKGEDALRRLGKEVIASFSTVGDTPSMGDATPVAALARHEFVAGNVDRVLLAYTDFVSALTQKPRIRQLLPISAKDVEAMLEGAGGERENDPAVEDETLFEPSQAEILEAILPRMTDIQVYQALLESAASEHSARMMAMRNATDAAGDMIDDLSFSFNQARQAAITREISEIAAGKATLDNA
jgi:F-type H+-transporting ATPase subunit gamma